jgi:Ca2+-binding EF-hand superfamily protein
MRHILATLTVVAFTAPVLAQAEMEFTTIDADASGTVTWEEVQAALPDLTEDEFKSADADGSGDLSEEEFAAIAG